MSRIAGQLRKYREAERSKRAHCGATRARFLTNEELAEWFTCIEQIERKRNKMKKSP